MAFGHLEGPLGPLDSCKKKCYPHLFYRGPPPPYPPATVPLPLAQGPPPRRRRPYPLHRVFFFFFFLAAILDFTDVKNVTEGSGGKEGQEGGDQAWFFIWIEAS